MAEGSVWAYVERIGAHAGLAADFVGQAQRHRRWRVLLRSSGVSYQRKIGRSAPIVGGMVLFLISFISCNCRQQTCIC